MKDSELAKDGGIYTQTQREWGYAFAVGNHGMPPAVLSNHENMERYVGHR